MLSKIPSAGFQDNVKFRNIIINGDMSIAQRGTSTASITGNGYHTVDRFFLGFGGSTAGTWTQSQSTDVPSGQGFAKSLKMDCTATVSLTTNTHLNLQQKIEGQNLQYLKKGTSSAESLTLSFWVKSNKTGTYICEFSDNDNTRSISKSYTINSASTWEKKIITIDGDTTGTLDNDNGASFTCNFWLVAGTDYTSGTLNTSWNSRTNANRAVGQVNLADSTSNEWYITGVQLEAGTTASDFEFLPVDVNLGRCQRYYITKSGLLAWGYIRGTTDTVRHFIVDFPVELRANPTWSHTWNTGSSASDFANTRQAHTYHGAGDTTSQRYVTTWTADSEL